MIESNINGFYIINPVKNGFSATWWRNGNQTFISSTGETETEVVFKTEASAKKAIEQNEKQIK